MVTAQDVVNNALSKVDKRVTVPTNPYGAQCVALIDKMVQELSNGKYNMAYTNAVDCLKKAEQQGLKVTYDGPGKKPKKASFYVIQTFHHPFGHIGVTTEDSDGYSIVGIEQNVDGFVDNNRDGVDDALQVGAPTRKVERTWHANGNLYVKGTDTLVGKMLGWFELPYTEETSTGGTSKMVKYINKSYLNAGNLYSIKHVVIHNDAGSAGATAEWYVGWLAGRDKNLGIAHYYIDRNTIARVVDTYKIAYHTGDGISPTSGNGTSIGYEVCQSIGASTADFLANEDMTLRQVAEDMLFYKLPVNRNTVRLHREFVPTSCPHRSWDLHGKSTNAVKDYFISRIKHFQSLGKTVDEMLKNENKPAPSAKPSATVRLGKIDQGALTYEVFVENIKSPSGVKEVLFPTWTQKDGQNDLVWYKGVKQSNGSYKYVVKASDHKNEQGIYVTHMYITTPDGKKHGVGGVDLYLNKQKPTGKIEVAKDIDKGTFKVTVTGVANPNGVKKVKLPTWSDNKGQDDLKWYEAKEVSKGVYELTVAIKDHNGEFGKYHVHGYVEQKNGQNVAFGGVVVDFTKPAPVVKEETVKEIVPPKVVEVDDETEVIVVTKGNSKIKHIVVTKEEYDKLRGK